MNPCVRFLICFWFITATSFAQKPNVILLMCDDLGYGDVQFLNAETPIQTPHLTAMAADGLTFTRFYAAAPVCSPTRGSCLTGRHPYRYGIYTANKGHMKHDEITLPELLQKHGYATGHFGKWHLGTLTTTIPDANRGGPKNKQHFAPPRQHGYDDSFVTESKVPTYDPMIRPKDGGENGWDFLRDRTDGVPYGTHYWAHDGTAVTDNLDGDDSRIIMDRAIPFIEKASRQDKPFFTAIWFHAPHLPVVAGPKYAAMYESSGTYERNYFGSITALDEQIGRLRAKLKDLHVADNTMLWFCSDNGPEGSAGKAPGSAGPFRGRKRSLYEGGVRVPGLLVWPGHTEAGTTTDFAAVTSDYLPTVLDAIGVVYPDDRPLDGISLLPAIDGTQSDRQQPIGFQAAKQIAWHNERHKLYSANNGKSWEMYDLVADPGETNDLSKDEPELKQTLVKAVTAWQKSCRASDSGADYGVSR